MSTGLNKTSSAPACINLEISALTALPADINKKSSVTPMTLALLTQTCYADDGPIIADVTQLRSSSEAVQARHLLQASKQLPSIG
jgi:hypothetical protein